MAGCLISLAEEQICRLLMISAVIYMITDLDMRGVVTSE